MRNCARNGTTKRLLHNSALNQLALSRKIRIHCFEFAEAQQSVARLLTIKGILVVAEVAALTSNFSVAIGALLWWL